LKLNYLHRKDRKSRDMAVDIDTSIIDRDWRRYRDI
jgi:hypothetical protein